MKKLADFIVEKRYFIIVLFLMFTVFSFYLSSKVNINYDITKYLPNSSETKIGMNIMNEEFEKNNSSDLKIMFQDVVGHEDKLLKEIKSIDNVSSVDYDNSKKYNKDNYTLFVLNVDKTSDSKEAKEVYDTVLEKFDDYNYDLSGSIYNEYQPVLPQWILITSIGSAIIILIIMCNSYIEPFLFLFTIGLAVFINKGTNIMFDSVSNITDSICAILQMALSMDYSIMLMNRYRQEKKKSKNKDAMKEALTNAFGSISSSSITTIVGLMALVFMSFTIGKDLGFVLAKGVLLSLICIFLCLPGLILMFDKLIDKTEKKRLNINMTKMGKLSYNLRYVALVLIIIVFGVSYALKGNLEILFTGNENDKIGQVFTENNQMAIIYNNKDEENIAKICKNVDTKKVDQTLCYGNTINDKLTYTELNAKLKDFGNDIAIDDYLLRIIYYNYYSKGNNKLTMNELVNFIESDVYNNEKINGYLDSEVKSNLELLKQFTSTDEINKKRSISELSTILGIDNQLLNKVMILYHADKTNITFTIPEFINYLNTSVLKNEMFKDYINNDMKDKISYLSKFITNDALSNEYNIDTMSVVFGMDKNTMSKLYLYYFSVNGVDTKLTINEFSGFILNSVVTNTEYSSLIDETTINLLRKINYFSNEELINTKLNEDELSLLFGMDKNLVSQILLIKNMPITNENGESEEIILAASPKEFIEFLVLNKDQEMIKDNMSEEILQQLMMLDKIMSSNSYSFNYQEMSGVLNMELNTTKSLYALNSSSSKSLKILDLINFILAHKNDEALSNIDNNTLNNLYLLKNIMESTLYNIRYNSSGMSYLMGLDQSYMNILYSYKEINNGYQEEMSLNSLINYLLNNSMVRTSIDSNSLNKLNLVNSVMTNSLNNTRYTSSDAYRELSKFNSNIEANLIDILYIYYGSIYDYNDSYKLTVENFVNYLNTNILKDTRFNRFIDKSLKNQIIQSNKTIKQVKKMLVGDNYSRAILNTEFDLEGPETFAFLKDLKLKLNKASDEVYLIGDSAMAFDLDKTFGREFNFISILTMILIFIVVAVTFKSLIIPLILTLIIQCAVYITMTILSFFGGSVYFISLLIVQSILMGATIDYAILFTSYYIEFRDTYNKKGALINAYNQSIHTILTSASVLIIVTFIVGFFASAIASKICMTISQGTLCATILVLFILPAVLAALDKFIIKKD